MVYHWVRVWSVPVFPYLPFVSFLAFRPFLWRFLLASFPPSFLSVDLGFSFPILFFFLLLYLRFCQASAFPPVISFRLQVVFSIIHVAFSSGGFVFPPGFEFWNVTKTKAKTNAKFTTSSLACTWPGACKPSSPSRYYSDSYHCHCRA